MAKYKLKNTNILHNGDLVKIGSVIELTDKEAKNQQIYLSQLKNLPIKTKPLQQKQKLKPKQKQKKMKQKKKNQKMEVMNNGSKTIQTPIN